MKTTTTKFGIAAFLLAATLASACGSGSVEDKGTTKSEASALSLDQWADDYCRVEGWYSDGVCDDFCPIPDDDCSTDVDCGCDVAPAIAMICEDGSVGVYYCGVGESGVCGSGFACGHVDACDCGPAPGAAWQCDDGSTGTYECVQHGDDTCGYEATCGGDTTPPSCDCGPAPGAAWMCDDGSTGTFECVTSDDGTCGYEETCGGEPPTDPTDPPTTPGELCDTCGAYPAIAMICEDGSTADTVCRTQPEGECAIRFECPE